jgi:hypothetical protein
LIEKNLINGKIVKKYDLPKTPLQRILESPHVSASVKNNLNEQFKIHNPFKLKKIIENKPKKIFSVCPARA